MHVPEEKRMMKQFEYQVVNSPFSSFEKMEIDGKYSEAYNENGLVAFIDFEHKQVYIFEDKYVEIITSNPTVFIKYTARV